MESNEAKLRGEIRRLQADVADSEAKLAAAEVSRARKADALKVCWLRLSERATTQRARSPCGLVFHASCGVFRLYRSFVGVRMGVVSFPSESLSLAFTSIL